MPVAGVAFAYGPDVDPSYEVGAAAPYSALRLLLLRTAAVLATSLPLALAAGAARPALSWTAVVLAAAGAGASPRVVLAASTWVDHVVAGVALGVAWACAVGSAAVDARPDRRPRPRSLLLVYAVLGSPRRSCSAFASATLTLLGSLS